LKLAAATCADGPIVCPAFHKPEYREKHCPAATRPPLFDALIAQRDSGYTGTDSSLTRRPRTRSPVAAAVRTLVSSPPTLSRKQPTIAASAACHAPAQRLRSPLPDSAFVTSRFLVLLAPFQVPADPPAPSPSGRPRGSSRRHPKGPRRALKPRFTLRRLWSI